MEDSKRHIHSRTELCTIREWKLEQKRKQLLLKYTRTNAIHAEQSVAKQQGLKRYTTNIPCAHGHMMQRYTISADCVVCNEARSRVIRATARAKRKGGFVPLSPQQQTRINSVYLEAHEKTVSTGVQYDVDHHYPYALGGKHVPENLVVMTHTENMCKGTQHPDMYEQAP